MTNVTPGFKNGIIANGVPSGKTAIRIVVDGAPATSIEMSPAETGRFVVQLLSSSVAAQAMTGNGLAPLSERKGASVEPSAIGLSQSPRKGYEVLVVRCGNMEFGLSIPHEALHKIAKAMLAATAAGKGH